VRNPQEELDQLLISHSIKKSQKRFLAANGIVISFTNGRSGAFKTAEPGKGKTWNRFARICCMIMNMVFVY
jgi:hypothetical protein